LPRPFERLWVFGDSHTTPGLAVSPQDSFWGLAAETLDIAVIMNCSRPRNSWTSVQQLLVGMSGQINWQNDLVFIGIPTLERITVFDNYKDTGYLGHKITRKGWSKENVPIACHHGLVCLQNYGTDKQLILHSDRSWLETDVMRQIFLLSSWLESVSANYLILNLSRDLDRNNRWGPSEFLLDYCMKLKPSILFEKTYQGINIGVNQPDDMVFLEGHHGPAGNRYFFDNSLLPKLKECGLC